MASNIKGITVQINGDTTGLEKALSSTNKQINSTQRELKEVEKGLKLDPSNVTLLSQKQALLNDAIEQTSDKLATLKKIKEEAEKSNVDKNTKEWRDLERQIASAESQLKGYTNQQQDLNNEIDNGTSKFASFLFENGANIAGMLSTFSAIVQVANKVVTSISDVALGTALLADDINTMAKQYNLSTEEIQKYLYASDLIDVDITTITKSMAKLTKSLTSTSKETTNAFEKLGIVTRDENNELRDSNELFYETIRALSEIENETEQDSLALQIFGRSASELGTLINGGVDQLEELSKYMEENGLLLSQEQLDALNETNDAFDTLKMTMSGFKNQLGSVISPVVNRVLSTLTNLIIGARDAWVDMQPAIQKITDKVEKFAKELWNDLSPVLNEIATLLWDAFKRLTATIIPLIERTWKWFSTSIYPIIKELAKTILPILADALRVVNELLDIAWKCLSDLWAYLEDYGVVDLFSNAFYKLSDVISVVCSWLKKAYEWFGNLIARAKEYLGINEKIASKSISSSGTISGGGGGSFSGGFGELRSMGFASGGINPIININVNNGNGVTSSQVRGWALQMVNVINEELGKAV